MTEEKIVLTEKIDVEGYITETLLRQQYETVWSDKALIMSMAKILRGPDNCSVPPHIERSRMKECLKEIFSLPIRSMMGDEYGLWYRAESFMEYLWTMTEFLVDHKTASDELIGSYVLAFIGVIKHYTHFIDHGFYTYQSLALNNSGLFENESVKKFLTQIYIIANAMIQSISAYKQRKANRYTDRADQEERWASFSIQRHRHDMLRAIYTLTQLIGLDLDHRSYNVDILTGFKETKERIVKEITDYEKSLPQFVEFESETRSD